MIKKILLLVCIIGCFLFPSFVTAASGERITGFSAEYHIQKDATVDVVENITYDFGEFSRHGIYRYIPYKYQNGNDYRIVEIKKVSVSDDDGAKIQFSSSKNDENLVLKIGDPNRTITGIKKYIISYSVRGTINYFENHDEFYWNVTGNGWDVSIDSASAKVFYPDGTTKETAKYTCSAGSYGDKKYCDTYKVEDEDGKLVAKFSQSNLSANEGLTIVSGFPKNLVEYVAPIKDTPFYFGGVSMWAMWLIGILIIAGPFISFILMYRVWRKSGRDPKINTAFPAQFDPPKGMTPVEVGAIITDKIDNKLASAELIYLAEQGYLKINKIEKSMLGFKSSEYEIEKIKDFDKGLNDYDINFFVEVMDGKQKITTSEMKKSASQSILNEFKNYKKRVFENLAKKGFYTKSPFEVQSTYYGVAGGLASAGIAIMVFITAIWPLSISLILSGIIVGFFGIIMPAKTAEGAKVKEHVLGLREYLSVAEKDRLKILNAPKANPGRFEKLLPYAIALGVEKEWAKQFEGIYNQSPSWYNDPGGSVFNAIIFTDIMDDFGGGFRSAAFVSAAASGTSGFSSGGGFSGGGFGGGGGGSW